MKETLTKEQMKKISGGYGLHFDYVCIIQDISYPGGESWVACGCPNDAGHQPFEDYCANWCNFVAPSCSGWQVNGLYIS